MPNLFKVPIKFIRLAPIESAIILFSSIILGLLQSLTAFTFLPLSDVIGIEIGENNKIISFVKSVFEKFRFEYSIGSILIAMIIFVSIISIINFSLRLTVPCIHKINQRPKTKCNKLSFKSKVVLFRF